MRIFSLILLTLSLNVSALELGIETSYEDNPDRTFIKHSNGSFLVKPTISNKWKFKSNGLIYLVKLDSHYQHDFELEKHRDAKLAASLVGLKIIKGNVLGFSFEAGKKLATQKDYNTSTDQFGKIFSDHLFADLKGFSELKISKALRLQLGASVRNEIYDESYSLFVNEKNDNLSFNLSTGLILKGKKFTLKPGVEVQRKIWKERRALSSEGFFVNPGEALVSDKIDTVKAQILYGVKIGSLSLDLSPRFILVKDQVNGGRTWQGAGGSFKAKYKFSFLDLGFNSSYQHKKYDNQLYTFQAAGNTLLLDENYSFGLDFSKKLSSYTVKLSGSIYRRKSNQIDDKNRQISDVDSSKIGFNISKRF